MFFFVPNCVRLLKGVSVTCAIFLDFGAAGKTLAQKRGPICSNGQSICSRTMRLKYKEREMDALKKSMHSCSCTSCSKDR